MAGALALAAPPWWEPRRWAKRAWRAAQRFWRLRVTRRYKVRAGGVVARGDEVLLISSRKTPGAWILPAGTAERGETLRETALREVREEALRRRCVCGRFRRGGGYSALLEALAWG